MLHNDKHLDGIHYAYLVKATSDLVCVLLVISIWTREQHRRKTLVINTCKEIIQQNPIVLLHFQSTIISEGKQSFNIAY